MATNIRPNNRPITLIGAYIQQKRPNHWECAKMRQRLSIEQYISGTMPADSKFHLIDSFGGKGGRKPVMLYYKFAGKPTKIDKRMGMLEMIRVDPEGNPSPGYTPVKVIFMQLDQHDGYTIPPRTSRRMSAAAPRTSAPRASAAKSTRASAPRASAVKSTRASSRKGTNMA